MVNRETIPTGTEDYSISVVTEQLNDGQWAAAATVTHSGPTAQQVRQLDLPTRGFATEAEAREWAVRSAREWVEQNVAKR
jgi:hypothetical protein